MAPAQMGSSPLGFLCGCGQEQQGSVGLRDPDGLFAVCLAPPMGWLAFSRCVTFPCGMAVSEQWGSPTTAAPPAHGHEAVFPMTHLRCLAAPFPLRPVSQRKSWAARVPGKGPHRALEHRAPNNPVGVCPSQPSPPTSVLAGGGRGRAGRETTHQGPSRKLTPPHPAARCTCPAHTLGPGTLPSRSTGQITELSWQEPRPGQRRGHREL